MFIMSIKRHIILPIVSAFMAFFTSKRQKADSETMEKLDFPASTKKMGVHMNDKVRNSWRHKWIKKG